LLNHAMLEGASFDDAMLSGASLDRATLWGAFLKRAKLQGASLNGAELQGAFLDSAQLQGASLVNAKLQGASLNGAELQGVALNFAQLQGASLDRATLWGASLSRAKLQGASLNGAELQGADFDYTQLDGASFDGAWLQGAALYTASFTYTRLTDVYAWRANISAACSTSRVSGHNPLPILSTSAPSATWSSEIAAFIERSVADIPGPRKAEMKRTNTTERIDAKIGQSAKRGEIRIEGRSQSILVEEVFACGAGGSFGTSSCGATFAPGRAKIKPSRMTRSSATRPCLMTRRLPTSWPKIT
jgi:uncharacterized protein YjbI with pentapeptide repeats